MIRKLIIATLVVTTLGFVSLAYAEPTTVPSRKVDIRIAKEKYQSNEVYRGSYQGKYTGMDGATHDVLIQAIVIKREKLDTEYSWTHTSNRAAGSELKVKVFQDGKAVLLADNPYGQLIETEALMPSGDILEVIVDATEYKKDFIFSAKPVKTMEEVEE